jgi:hypothetical protein
MSYPYARSSGSALVTTHSIVGAGASLSHAEARRIVAQAWQQVHGRSPTTNELNYTQAIALLETGYGRAGQFAQMAAQGQYNWGALERRRPQGGECPPGTAPGQDQGDVCFLVFPSDVEAAAVFIRNLTKRHWPTVQAMKGSPEDVARAMRVQPAYYTGNPGSEESKVNYYASAIRNGVRSIGGTVSSVAASSFPWLLALGVTAAAAYWWHAKHGTPKFLTRLGIPR